MRRRLICLACVAARAKPYNALRSREPHKSTGAGADGRFGVLSGAGRGGWDDDDTPRRLLDAFSYSYSSYGYRYGPAT